MMSQPFFLSSAAFELLLQANQRKSDGDDRTALTLYLAALERFGESAELLAAIADCYFALALGNPKETGENHQQAIAWMRRAIALAPENARLHAHLAQFYELGTLEVDRAAEEYRTAINLNPHDVWALFNAASLAGMPEEVVSLDEAITWLERAVQLEPDEPDYHLRLGVLYHEAGRVADAKRACLRALLCPRPLDPQFVRRLKEVAGIDREPPAPR